MEDKCGAIDRMGSSKRELINLLREGHILREQQTRIYQSVVRIATAYANLYALCSTDEERQIAEKDLDFLETL